MDYKRTTMVPNIVFDRLGTLSEKELKVLLIVIRQTIGWVTKNGKRKNRDWISHRYFIERTGLSRKSITQALSLLISKGMVKAENSKNKELNFSDQRKGCAKIFYSCTLFSTESTFSSKAESLSTDRKNIPSTKLKHTKLNHPTKVNSTHHIGRLTDVERYHQIINSKSNL